MDEIGILPQFRGTLVRDGFSSYQWYGQCRHSLCNAHLLVEKARQQPEAELPQKAEAEYLRRYDRLVRCADRLNPPQPKGAPTDVSKNKLLQKPTPGSLVKRLQRRRDEILRFMTDRSVPSITMARSATCGWLNSSRKSLTASARLTGRVASVVSEAISPPRDGTLRYLNSYNHLSWFAYTGNWFLTSLD